MALKDKNTSMGKSSRAIMQDEILPSASSDPSANSAVNEEFSIDEQEASEEPGED